MKAKRLKNEVATKPIPWRDRRVYTILLYEKDAEFLRKLGAGNRSEGARRIIYEDAVEERRKEVAEENKQKKRKAIPRKASGKPAKEEAL
jgi:hypothetical protein